MYKLAKDWKKDIYPNYWSRKSREYGFDNYCSGLFNLLTNHNQKCAFELAIGNGFPFAEKLSAIGVSVSGCDISSHLLSELSKDYPIIKTCVAGYEDLEEVKSKFPAHFDVVYCFRSTWYFVDIARAIDFMVDLCKPGGVIIFDIMNADSNYNKKMLRKKNASFPLTVLKNIVKCILNKLGQKSYMMDKIFGFREIMYSPQLIKEILNTRQLNYSYYTLAQIESLANLIQPVSSKFSDDQKITFVVKLD